MYEFNNDNTSNANSNWYLLTYDNSFIYINNLHKFIQLTDLKLPYTYMNIILKLSFQLVIIQVAQVFYYQMKV